MSQGITHPVFIMQMPTSYQGPTLKQVSGKRHTVKQEGVCWDPSAREQLNRMSSVSVRVDWATLLVASEQEGRQWGARGLYPSGVRGPNQDRCTQYWWLTQVAQGHP